jgi:uncharacterized repeat protein (TIGR03803 family)
VRPRASFLPKFCLLLTSVLASVAWAGTENVLHTFTGADGEDPNTGVIFDGAGNLYGTTFYGGEADCGVVFKLAPSADGWTYSTIYTFRGAADGGHPSSPLIFDAAGNLYGATYGQSITRGGAASAPCSS